MKVFHDDNRFPPNDAWEWAKTNADAIAMLETGDVSVISLDMDLGAVEGKDYNYGSEQGRTYRGIPCREVQWLRNMNNDPGENGIDIVTWMVAHPEFMPERVIVHTWNSWGGNAMVKCFADAGHSNVERIFWSASNLKVYE